MQTDVRHRNFTSSVTSATNSDIKTVSSCPSCDDKQQPTSQPSEYCSVLESHCFCSVLNATQPLHLHSGEPEHDSDNQPLLDMSGESTATVCHNIVEEWKLMAHSALPEWLKDNDYLHYYHRPPLPCMASCFKSVFSIHSETVNIWTHLVGSLIMLAIMAYFYLHPEVSSYTWQRKLVFSLFFVAAAMCMTFSWVYHTVYCHSSRMNNLFCKLDYSGISVLILGSFIPFLYYAFYCDDSLMLFYITIMAVLSSLCIVFSLANRFATPVFRPVRAAMFVGLGASGVIPFVHVVSRTGLARSVVEVSALQIILVAALYISGAVIYALRVPERFFPGKVDVVGHSHQVFHVLVVCGALTHYFGIKSMAEHRTLIGECGASAA